MNKSSQRFILVPKAKKKEGILVLKRVLTEIENIPGVDIDRIVGSDDRIKRILIIGDEEGVNRLRSLYGEHLIIEQDKDLRLL